MSVASSQRRRAQAGFTLIELMIASAIGLIVMTALTSVVFTTYQANQIAISRVQASSVIGIFQATVHDDFALSSVPQTPGGCGTSAQPCTTEAIQLTGEAIQPTGCALSSSGAPPSSTVKYQWYSSTHVVDRTVNGALPYPLAAGFTNFSWYIDGAAPSQSVVVTLTVTVGAYSQSQTMRFYPRVVSVPAYVGVPAC